MIIGDELVMTDNRQTTDRQTDRQADRQTFLSRPSSIREIFFSFFCLWEGENKWGEIYTSLLCSQGDNFLST
jgi:hypothetical protein